MTRTEMLRASWRAKKAAYRATHPERCLRCCARLVAAVARHCCRCLARIAESKHPGKRHDLEAHAAMMAAARDPAARCAISGLTLRQLKRRGEWLECDRIDSALGYVAGNMQLLARRLNASKGSRTAPLAATVAAMV